MVGFSVLALGKIPGSCPLLSNDLPGKETCAPAPPSVYCLDTYGILPDTDKGTWASQMDTYIG
jgi:hypothetical protein